jgi:presenilin-like A22 family membrane protease
VRRIEFRQQFDILILFMIVQFGGLLVASLVYTTTPITYINSSSQSSEINTPQQALWFFAYFIIATLIILLAFKLYHGDILFRLFEAFVIVVPSFFVFAIVIGYLFPNANISIVSFAALAMAIALIVAKNKYSWSKNAVVIIASIGVGLVLGIDFSFGIAYLLVLIIAAYDYIAVFVTKHMLTLAKVVSSKDLAFLIASTDIEVIPKGFFTKKEAKKYEEYKKEIKKVNNPIIKKLIQKGKLPLISQVQLGAGDLGIPLMLAISSYKIGYNYFLPIAVIIGGSIGMLFTMYIQKKYLVPLPAIPPLFSFMSIALGLAVLPISVQDGIVMMLAGIIVLTTFVIGAFKSSKEKS